MARAAVLGRLTWRVATVVAVRPENARAVTIVLDVPGWPGHLAGQHVDLRLTAEDGYQAQRSYSIASAPDGDRVELTVVEVEDGEVSEYLTTIVAAGDQMEVRGPVGGWFVWRPDAPGPFRPVMLVAGGSGAGAADGHDQGPGGIGDKGPVPPGVFRPRLRVTAVP